MVQIIISIILGIVTFVVSKHTSHIYTTGILSKCITPLIVFALMTNLFPWGKETGYVITEKADQTEMFSIVTLQDNNQVAGTKYVGIGHIQEKMYYCFYEETDKGYKYHKLSPEDYEIYIKECIEIQALREELRFIEEKLNSFDCLLKMYCVDNKMYGIFLKEDRSILGLAYEITTYEITLHEKVCASYAEVHELFDKSKRFLELVSIDTYTYCEKRKGHASKHLDIYKQICFKNKIDIIYGQFLTSTSIGIENLKSFYRKNGFDISEFGFSIQIKEAIDNK